MGYQIVFDLCYLLGGRIGTFALQRHIAIAFRCKARPLNEVRSDMAWLYIGFMTNFIDVVKRTLKWETQRNAQVSGSDVENCSALVGEPQIPALYVYGTKKVIMFHENEFLDRVCDTPGSVVR